MYKRQIGDVVSKVTCSEKYVLEGTGKKVCLLYTSVERICEEAWRMGIKYLTVYAFSTENWNRPDSEVSALMKLLRNYMKTCLKTAAKNDIDVYKRQEQEKQMKY